MSRFSRWLTVTAAAVLAIPVCGFFSVSASQPEETILATAAPAYAPLAALQGGERFPRGAQILRIAHGEAEPLVKGFAATADASVSFDGKRILFAGKKNAADPWQIWEIVVHHGDLRRLYAGLTDAIRPFYLPAGQFVFARRGAAGFQLVAAGKNLGDDAPLAPIPDDAANTLTPLTNFPGSAIADGVLTDGRILFDADFPLGAGSTPEMYLVYPDGSGVESYRCDHGRGRWGGAQLASGDLVFTHGRSLARFTSAQANEVAVAAPQAAYAGAIAETAQGDWLLSAQPGATRRYELMLWKPGATALRPFHADRGENLVEPVVLAPHERPRIHPSVLAPWDYANLLAFDARLSRAGDLKTPSAAVRLESLDANGHVVLNGTAPVASDGSFFVRVPGDRAIRFALLDAKGAVVRRQRGWFWARSGEQRICVGCHTGPERAVDNRLPNILRKSNFPTDLTGHISNAAPPRQAIAKKGEN